MAATEYKDFLDVWKNADQSLPEIAAAQRFLASTQIGRVRSPVGLCLLATAVTR
jgi:hypothetical protein